MAEGTENTEPRGEDVPLEAILEVAAQADADADDREEMHIAWSDVAESSVQKLGKGSFSVGQSFELTDQEAQLEVVEIDDLGEGADLGEGSPGKQDQFRVIFRSQDAAIDEGCHNLRNDDLGEIALYLTAADREDEEAPCFQATFC